MWKYGAKTKASRRSGRNTERWADVTLQPSCQLESLRDNKHNLFLISFRAIPLPSFPPTSKIDAFILSPLVLHWHSAETQLSPPPSSICTPLFIFPVQITYSYFNLFSFYTEPCNLFALFKEKKKIPQCEINNCRNKQHKCTNAHWPVSLLSRGTYKTFVWLFNQAVSSPSGSDL